MEMLAFILVLAHISGGLTCGESAFTPSMISSYIVGGQVAGYGHFPWQVGLVDNGYLICGGTLVEGTGNRAMVITAAHCLSGKNPDTSRYSVVFGMHSTGSAEGRLVVGASSITVHQSYNSRTMANDIAIIDSGLTLSGLSGTFAKPACLPTGTYKDKETSLVSGWGTTSSGGSSSSTLRYVLKPILDWNFCNTATRNAGQLDSTMLCAGETGKDACQGDSGGPLVAYRNNRWELVGVVSWGFGCGDVNAPGVYADTFYLLNWINARL